jgi:hypothetical protein
MMMPWFGTLVFEREWLTLSKFQVENFERVLVKEMLANEQLVKTMKGKLGEFKSYRGAEGE